MGTKMNLNDLSKDTLALLTTLNSRYETLSKKADEDGWLLTHTQDHAGEHEVNTKNLTKIEARELIIRIDFMQVGLCDQRTHPWQDDIGKLITLLKKRYFSVFGESVYA